MMSTQGHVISSSKSPTAPQASQDERLNVTCKNCVFHVKASFEMEGWLWTYFFDSPGILDRAGLTSEPLKDFFRFFSRVSAQSKITKMV